MRRFGLIGKTLAHSFSQTYFSKKFEQEGITDCSYQNFELSQIQDIDSLLDQYPDLEGFNITIPYKEAILPYLFKQNEVVQAVGACNCVKVVDGRFIGFNTDVVGFRQSLQPQLKPHHTKALILGWGGAAKAVAYALTSLHIDYLVVSRNKYGNTISYSEVDIALLEQYTLFINTTPLGMYPNVDEAPEIPYNLLSAKHFLFDLIYNPVQTRSLELGAQQGAQTSNGYDMLIGQAEASWRIWNTL
jgi:shikimate dehydrogenase